MTIFYVGLFLVGSYLILSALATLWSVFLSLIALPFAGLKRLGQKKKSGPGHREKISEMYKVLDQQERDMNATFEKQYFPRTSGSLDENGIPYL